MNDTPCGRIAKVTWKEIASEVQKHHPALASGMRKIRGIEKMPAFIADYTYGQLLVNGGMFLPPCAVKRLHKPLILEKTSWCPCCRELDEITISRRASQSSWIPLSLVLQNCVEIHLVSSEHRTQNHVTRFTTPLRILNEGGTFGVFETCLLLRNCLSSAPPPWSISAGARSIDLMIPFANEGKVSNRLTDLAAKNNISVGMGWEDIVAEDWTFASMVAKLAKLDYTVKVVIFPLKFVEALKASSDARVWLYETDWEQSQHLRGYGMQRAVLHMAGRRTDDYLDETAMHVCRIARGELPAFVPVTNVAIQYGPLLAIQRWLYENIWHSYKNSQLGADCQCYPAIVQAQHLVKAGDFGFYSLSRPSLLVRPPIWGDEPKSFLTKEMNKITSKLATLAQNDPDLDIDATRAFVKTNHADLNQAEFIPTELPGIPGEKDTSVEKKINPKSYALYTGLKFGSSFFTGCLRIVRKGT